MSPAPGFNGTRAARRPPSTGAVSKGRARVTHTVALTVSRTLFLIASCQLPSEQRSTHHHALRWVLELAAKLEADASPAIIQHVSSELGQYRPPTIPGKSLVTQELISKCLGNLVKVGEFLNKLNEIVRSKGVLSYAVSARIPSFVQELQPESACESLLQRISRLYFNWGKDAPVEPKADRLLNRIAQEYGNEIGAIAGWEDRLMKETEETFEKMISKLQPSTVVTDVQGICAWLDEQLCRIVRSSWTKTYSVDDQRDLESCLRSAESEAKDEIAGATAQLRSALDQLASAQSSPLFSRHRQTLAEHKTRLEQDASALSQLPNQLLSTPFGKVVHLAMRHLEEWQAFYSSTFQVESERIGSWLEQHSITEHREDVMDAMGKVQLPISQLDVQLRQRGIDALKLLEGSKASPILVLFAAAWESGS